VKSKQRELVFWLELNGYEIAFQIKFPHIYRPLISRVHDALKSVTPMPNLTPRARELRKNATRAEQHLWYEHLRFCQPKVRRQHVLAGFILDFYCPKLHLAIELDGTHHYTPEGQARDAWRTSILEAHRVTVIRFPNSEVLERLEGVIAVLEGVGLKVKSAPPSLRDTSPNAPHLGEANDPNLNDNTGS
jgi:very-short-patch-repair endonuclease